MNTMFNISQRFVYLKDMTGVIDFDKINDKWPSLVWTKNVDNQVTVDKFLFDSPEFADIKQACVDECKTYLNNSLNIADYYTDLKMTNSWGNVTFPGEQHHEHMHPFSVVSGVLYLDNNPSNLKLYVESSLPEVPHFITRKKTFVSLESLCRDTGVDAAGNLNLKNHLVLFLSNFHHWVERDENAVLPRRSIAFNTYWQGKTGQKDDYLGSFDY